MKIRSLLIALVVVGAVAMTSAQELVVIGGVKYTIHDVAKGETLYSLSRQYGVTIDDIKGANEALANGLKAGQRIKIPLQAEKVADSSPKTQLHKVMKGETLYSLSKQYNLTVEELREANPHVKKGLKAGQLIEIPVKQVVVEQPAPQLTPQPIPQFVQSNQKWVKMQPLMLVAKHTLHQKFLL